MNQKILDKAIERAKKNGWKHPWHPDVEDCFELIYDHDFAKALWGEKDQLIWEKKEIITNMPAWRWHLMWMVVDQAPLNYLEDNI